MRSSYTVATPSVDQKSVGLKFTKCAATVEGMACSAVTPWSRRNVYLFPVSPPVSLLCKDSVVVDIMLLSEQDLLKLRPLKSAIGQLPPLLLKTTRIVELVTTGCAQKSLQLSATQFSEIVTDFPFMISFEEMLTIMLLLDEQNDATLCAVFHFAQGKSSECAGCDSAGERCHLCGFLWKWSWLNWRSWKNKNALSLKCCFVAAL